MRSMMNDELAKASEEMSTWMTRLAMLDKDRGDGAK